MTLSDSQLEIAAATAACLAAALVLRAVRIVILQWLSRRPGAPLSERR